jgi:hypothetical protein
VSKKPKSPPLPDDPEQSRRFEQTAIDAEAEQTGAAFERVFDVVVPASKPPPKRASVRKRNI